MATDDHSRLIRAAANRALAPLGFQQKGRSRVWFADRGFWALLVEFQPSGFSKGSYLNVAAMWLWGPSDGWVFDHCKRAGRFIEFESLEQFKPEAEWLAGQAGVEVMLMGKKFESLDAIACYLKQQVDDERIGQNPWALYHAAIAAGLTNDREFSLQCFTALIDQKPEVDAVRQIQAEARMLAKLLAEGEEFPAAIRKKVAGTRTTLKLPPLAS